jgi:hypothetical protein
LKNNEFAGMKKGNVMKMNLKMFIALASALILLLLAGSTSAQSSSDSSVSADVLYKAIAQTAQARGGAGGSVAFSTSIVGSYSKPVTGAPYSAQIVTESVQPFADGNSITHTSTSTVYRDSLGRTRREQNINVVGPSQLSGSPIQFITIDDPVTGVHYTLNPNKMIATEFTAGVNYTNTVTNTLPKKVIPDDGGNVSITYFSSGDDVAAAGGGGGRGGTISVMPTKNSPDDVTTESLGADTMQGLSVLGTRVTRTIPVGQIGNAQPILIVTDKWYSQDLQIDVKTVHSDPRTGTTTTALINLVRTEPNLALFTVPPGYTITTPGSGTNKVTLKQQEPL